MSVKAGAVDTARGELTAGGPLDLTAASLAADGATLGSGGAMNINVAGNASLNAGTLDAAGNLTVSAAAIEASGATAKSNANTQVTANTISGGSWQAQGDVTATAQGALNVTGGGLIAGGNVMATGQGITLSEAAANHAVRVLRLREGDAVTLFNGDGHDYGGTISLGKRDARVHLHDREAVSNESPLAITLVQAIARGEKMDLILQKATELGVVKIVRRQAHPALATRARIGLRTMRAGADSGSRVAVDARARRTPVRGCARHPAGAASRWRAALVGDRLRRRGDHRDRSRRRFFRARPGRARPGRVHPHHPRPARAADRDRRTRGNRGPADALRRFPLNQ